MALAKADCFQNNSFGFLGCDMFQKYVKSFCFVFFSKNRLNLNHVLTCLAFYKEAYSTLKPRQNLVYPYFLHFGNIP